ncbi:hypothetical protein LPUS_08289 [Lasallia pustulata]|nr:hypothetical protein LPUS_08289 [Lasallia pustulata]
MGPPAAPISSTTGSIQLPPRDPPFSGDTATAADNSGVGVGPGPLRHPRPLTAADLHMQLEKEQEAVVNRLTRELSILRQQSASVTSTTSSTSTGLVDPTDHNANHMLSGASHPTPSRRHRSSSSLSTRSINTPGMAANTLVGPSGNAISTAAGVTGSTVSGITPARDSNAPGSSQTRETLSRQNSIASSRPSGTSSPSRTLPLQQYDHYPHHYSHRQSGSFQHGYPLSVQASQPSMARSPSLGSGVATARYEEVTQHRIELEAVKRENEALKRRIRDLERSLNSRRLSDMGRDRSESASTSASVPHTANSQGHPQSRNADDEHDVVRVGESAGSVGVDGGT